MTHRRLRRNRFHDLGVDAPIALQEAENHTFAAGAASTFALSSSAEVGLIEFDLPFQSPGFELGEVKQRLAQSLVHARDDLHVHPEVLTQPVRRHALIEPLEDRDLTPQAREALRSTATRVPAFHVTARRSIHLERTAEHTLATPQKVGRTTEMGLFPRNHRDLPYSLGYVSP